MGNPRTFPAHVVVDQVPTPGPARWSPMETGCMANACLCPRRTSGGAATGDQPSMGPEPRAGRGPGVRQRTWSALICRLA